MARGLGYGAKKVDEEGVDVMLLESLTPLPHRQFTPARCSPTLRIL